MHPISAPRGTRDLAPQLVRGLNYYAPTTTRTRRSRSGTRHRQGTHNALGGWGGRHDGLGGALGFAATLGVGYALGVDRIPLVAIAAGLAPIAAKPVDDIVGGVRAVLLAEMA